MYKMDADRFKDLKYICDRCGAYNPKNQSICGICKSSHIRKASKREIEETIILYEKYK